MGLSIRKNDRVEVIAGRNRTTPEKQTVSRVLRVMPGKGKALVENVNMIARHMRARGPKSPAGIVRKEAPIHLSNVMLYCDKCKRGVRFGTKVSDDGKEKHRVCKSCGAVI